MSRPLVIVGLLIFATSTARAGEVKGRVEMPDTCSPSVSPAVVTLEPLDESARPATPKGVAAVDLIVVNQHGLQFEPRVRVATVGQTIRFTNQDGETHNVHIITPGFSFNESMKPNEPKDYRPGHPGVIRLVCDVHSHMRGFVVVTASPWAKVCQGGGAFRFADVPDGRYLLKTWHEMGEPLTREVEVQEGRSLDLGAIVLKGFPVAPGDPVAAPIRAWPDVTDRIGVLLSESREAAKRPEGLNRARKLADDAYLGEFEASDMEAAVRRHLGFKRSGAIEGEFLAFRSAIRPVSEGKMAADELVTRSRALLVDLARASHELTTTLKIVDRRDVGTSADPADSVAMPAASEQAEQLKALAASFRGVAALADAGQVDEAASAMIEAYFNDFHPLERIFNTRRPQEVTPLETRFGAIRGRINLGLKGPDLMAELDGLRGEIVTALGRCESGVAGSFGLAFANSLVTILREGIEVILLLTMLVTLVAKTGHPRGLGAIRWGIGAAVGASILTAIGLNFLVSSTQGRTREVVEGAVMLAAATILFYVSYWLISQTQAKRWADFLKGRIAKGAEVGGLWTLGLTAFLAVYREGAETALLYQAMIAGQGGAQGGILGLAAGLAVGLLILAAVAVVIRGSSVRLPLRPFFQVTGFLLFAMAIVFAGNGVFELQGAGYIKTTPLEWLGSGLPALGLHPSTQALSIQGLLLLGGALAFILPSSPSPSKAKPAAVKVEQEAEKVSV